MKISHRVSTDADGAMLVICEGEKNRESGVTGLRVCRRVKATYMYGEGPRLFSLRLRKCRLQLIAVMTPVCNPAAGPGRTERCLPPGRKYLSARESHVS